MYKNQIIHKNTETTYLLSSDSSACVHSIFGVQPKKRNHEKN